MAINIFTGATNQNYGTSTNWSLGVVPTATDGHIVTFDATSPNCTVNASNRFANNIDFTGYTNTITFTNALTVSGNITLAPTMSIAGANVLAINNNGTITTNGVTWPNGFTFSGTSKTFTIVGTLTVFGITSFSGATSTIVNGGTLSCYGSVTIANASHIISGTTQCNLNGTTTWTHISTSTFGLPLNINTLGTVTFSSAGLRYGGSGAVLTYTSGTVAGTKDLKIYSGCTINTSGMTWTTFTNAASVTITLTSDLNISGSFTCTVNSLTINGLFNVYVGGSIHRSTSGAFRGSATIVLNGTGNWTDVYPSSEWSINMTIDTLGTIVLGSDIRFRTGLLKYVQGTVDFTTNSNVFTINQAATTLDTGLMTFRTLVLNNTITLNSTLRATNIQFGSGGLCTLLGSFGFIVNNFDFILTSRSLYLTAGNTYTINSSMTCLAATAGARNTIQSSTAAAAFLTLTYGATQDVRHCNATWINSSGGQTIYTSSGTLSNTVNWNVGVAPTNQGNFFFLM